MDGTATLSVIIFLLEVNKQFELKRSKSPFLSFIVRMLSLHSCPLQGKSRFIILTVLFQEHLDSSILISACELFDCYCLLCNTSEPRGRKGLTSLISFSQLSLGYILCPLITSHFLHSHSAF